MSELLLTERMLEWLRSGLDHRIYWDPTQDKLVCGYSHHSGSCAVVLTPDDVEQCEGDLGTASGIVVHRLLEIRDHDEDWSDPDGEDAIIA